MEFNPELPCLSNFDYPEAALHACICDSNTDVASIRLRALLSTCSPNALNHLDDKWGSPLHVAIRYDNLDATDQLLRAGADAVTQREFRGMGFGPPAPIMLAISLGRMALLQRLWQHMPPEMYANGGSRPYFSCLAHAARCGQVDILEWLLGVWDRWSQKALSWVLKAAATRLDFFFVEILLPRMDYSSDVLNEALQAAAVDTQYENAELSRELCTTAECLSQERIIRALINKGADPNAISRDGEPLVTETARFTERAVALRALLERGADPNATRKNGNTALHLLATPIYTTKSLQTTRKPHEVGIRLLLQHGASMYTKAARGELPLHCAAFGGNMRIFQLYLSALIPEDQNSTVFLRLDNGYGESLLHWAAAGGQCDMLEHLLSLDGSSAHVNDQTDNGWTPLMCALVPESSASKGAQEAIQAARLLLAHGADPLISTTDGWTPLHCLALHRDTRPYGEAYVLTKELIAMGVDLDARAAQLNTRRDALGHYAQVALEETGASPRRLFRTGMTPLLLAADRGAFGVSRALIDSGADLSCTDGAGRDAVQLAWRWRYLHEEDMYQ